MAKIIDYIKHSWSAFRSQDAPDETKYVSRSYNPTISDSNPSRTRINSYNERSVIVSILNKIAVDVSQIIFYHQTTEESEDGYEYKLKVDDNLTNILSYEANIDQTGPELIKALVFKMLDEGSVALVPTATDKNPLNTESYDVEECRIGTIVGWAEDYIKVKVFNPKRQDYTQVLLPKKIVPIIENPFYATMNEPSSVFQRLVRTLKTIDRLNDKNNSSKLDLIIQLPYAARSSAKKEQAKERRDEIESQLNNSQLGIAYIDASEKVIQLNRAVENNLWQEAQDLLGDLYAQLGMSPAVFNGTANEQEIFNYYTKTLKPICSTIALNISRKWLSKNARTRGHSIGFFQDPFELLPTTQLFTSLDMAVKDQFISSNEARIMIGRKPSNNPNANALANPYINPQDSMPQPEGQMEEQPVEEEDEFPDIDTNDI